MQREGHAQEVLGRFAIHGLEQQARAPGMDPDLLVRESKLPIDRVLFAVTLLEVSGKIQLRADGFSPVCRAPLGAR